MNNDNFTVQVSGAVDAIEWACVLWGRHLLNGWASRAANLNQILLKLEHSSVETIEMIHKATAVAAGDWQLHHDNAPTHISHLVQSFLVKHQITQVTQSHYSLHLVPCDFRVFSKLKSPLKGKRFQTICQIQENMTGQLMGIGRTVWGPKVTTLKGTEVLLSCVQCFLYLVSSSINVSIFRITWPDTFWTDLRVCVCVCVCVCVFMYVYKFFCEL